MQFKQNKKRFFKFGIMSAVLLLLSLLFLMIPQYFTSSLIKSTYVISGIGIVGIIFFGTSSLYNWRKILNSKLDLTISDEGIKDTTSVFKYGWIEWKDILGFELRKISNAAVICVQTRNPEMYMERIKSQVVQRAAEKNKKTYGTPILINVSSLPISPNELEHLLNEELLKRKA